MTKKAVEALEKRLIEHFSYMLGKPEQETSLLDKYFAISYSIRDLISERFLKTYEYIYGRKGKIVNYLSMEFLIGRLLYNNILNLRKEKEVEDLLKKYDLTIDEIAKLEDDAGLGNGGLGRLAACFLDSLATLGYLSYGYSIRYEYGIFKQLIVNGYQQEAPDDWLRNGYPWEFKKQEESVTVRFFGKLIETKDDKGNTKYELVDSQDIVAIPYDVYITGYDSDIVSVLRLWSPKSKEGFIFNEFEKGNYDKALWYENNAGVLSKVLYPNDAFFQGRELRLKQEFFFVSASMQDIIRRFKKRFGNDFSKLPETEVVQLNDTHPALAIPELMRILIEEEGLSWKDAFEITKKTIAYTNHTVMPEALEKWEAPLVQNLLPRHYKIIEEINSVFLDEVSKKTNNDLRMIVSTSIFEEGNIKKVRMANMCSAFSFSINGVSALHTEILKKSVLADFYKLYPEKFNNKTNGITQRRWLLQSNRDLAKLLNETIGDEWIKDLSQLKKLEAFADDSTFLEKLDKVKRKNKERLAKYVKENLGLDISSDSIFDIQVKRIHEYKRQHLNAMKIIHLYYQIKSGALKPEVPFTFFFAGKSAPGYKMAKLIIKLINSISEKIYKDPTVSKYIKVVFLPNYNVSLAEIIMPAAEVSEQISTAGTEASGTGNMKFALNGALTLGTLDGANVEILEEVGEENIYIFGLKTEEVEEYKRKGLYNPFGLYLDDERIRKVVDSFKNGEFSPDNPELFADLYENLLFGKYAPMPDQYFLLADFDSYVKTHHKIEKDYQDKFNWNKKSLYNIARCGKFSSDRTIEDYVRDIWKVEKMF